MSLDAPVAFFIFNRPDTTRRVFEAIREARPTTLLVVSDGPRDRPGEAALCAETRSVLGAIDWPCHLHTNFSNTNLGIPRRFASAFRWIFDLVDEAIILEGDCLPHSEFFTYCAELLRHYRADSRVMWIGGTNPLLGRYGDGSYFFARTNWVWGWATWKRAWRSFDIAIGDYSAFQRSQQICQVSPCKRLQRGYMAVFERAYAGEWINWDAQSTFAIWNNDGVSIVPNGNLVSNIGFGARAENTKSEDDPLANLQFRPLGPIVHPSDMMIQTEYDIRAYDSHCSWMNDYAARRKYRRLPFFKTARTLYQRVLRYISAWRPALRAAARWASPLVGEVKKHTGLVRKSAG